MSLKELMLPEKKWRSSNANRFLLFRFISVVSAVFGVKCKQGIRPEYIAGCFSRFGKAVIDAAWGARIIILNAGIFGRAGQLNL